ncbi:DUF4340 domain-containing protein [candidate division KSB1 bacterium]
MNEKQKTLIYGGIAVFLALIAIITGPRTITPEQFLDQGEFFFPGFEDPNAAQTLEVVDYDEETGTARPFKVTFSGNRWSIPSHHNYPADAKDRLAKTAAGVIGIRKDDFRTDNAAEHEATGVIDPLDETATSLSGRGQRVTIKGENEVVLADFIVGNEVENRENFRFVRVPGQKRVYAVRMNIEISTRFSDWIDGDLLRVEKNRINKVMINDYSINEQTRSIDQRDEVILDKDGNLWMVNRMTADQEVQPDSMSKYLTALDELSIVGVRPKPEGLTSFLTQVQEGANITQSDMLSLQSRGYFFTRDGSLRSNEGEIQTRTDDGVVYTLRFGEIVSGSGLALTAGIESQDEDESGSGENRYLFISAQFDESFFDEPVKPGNTDFFTKADSLWSDADRRNKELQDAYDEWEQNVRNGRTLAESLNTRFAPWYYVISSDNFIKLTMKRNSLVVRKEADGN